ncbi:MAG: aminoglycoside phosphotransferase family protein [Anaeroplasmataceae bacterium]|nr:aminoglycoside phosphotransferase family protein [Anaeroplasmataceae bacterium]
MNFPSKWRETVDPYQLKYKNFLLIEVLGYPHAGNDVFFARGIYRKEEKLVFIKVGRQKNADIKNEVEILNQLSLNYVPKIIDYDEQMMFRVSIALEGERLSTIVGENNHLESLDYLDTYGKALAEIHCIKGKFHSVKDRRFFHVPPREYFEENHIDLFIYDYLENNKPKEKSLCFCHGDFHYANILWKDKQISGILDWELAGIGIREFDIAWAIIVRPSQKFLKEKVETKKFIQGYQSITKCNEDYIKYYEILIYVWFYQLGEEAYKAFVLKKIKQYLNQVCEE